MLNAPLGHFRAKHPCLGGTALLSSIADDNLYPQTKTEHYAITEPCI